VNFFFSYNKEKVQVYFKRSIKEDSIAVDCSDEVSKILSDKLE